MVDLMEANAHPQPDIVCSMHTMITGNTMMELDVSVSAEIHNLFVMLAPVSK